MCFIEQEQKCPLNTQAHPSLSVLNLLCAAQKMGRKVRVGFGFSPKKKQNHPAEREEEREEENNNPCIHVVMLLLICWHEIS